MSSALTQLDLTNFDREPIHISGAIQPHGLRLGLAESDPPIVQGSENTSWMFGVPFAELLGAGIDAVLGSASVDHIRTALERSAIEDANPTAMTIDTRHGGMNFDALLHRSSGEIVLELEPVNVARILTPHEFHRVVRTSVESFAAVRTVAQLGDAAVGEVARLTGFDRVMVYRFDDDWHGEVIAERHAAGMEPYLGYTIPLATFRARRAKSSSAIGCASSRTSRTRRSRSA